MNVHNLQLSHKVMVAARNHFEQSATWLGRDVWTLLATISNDFCGFIWKQIILKKGWDLIVTKVSYSVQSTK